MSLFIRKFICLDTFGEPVTVNFKGDSTFKTFIGAFCTICLYGFILAFTTISIIDVMQYRDPQITQVRISYLCKSNNFYAVLNF